MQIILFCPLYGSAGGILNILPLQLCWEIFKNMAGGFRNFSINIWEDTQKISDCFGSRTTKVRVPSPLELRGSFFFVNFCVRKNLFIAWGSGILPPPPPSFKSDDNFVGVFPKLLWEATKVCILLVQCTCTFKLDLPLIFVFTDYQYQYRARPKPLAETNTL